MTLNGTTNGPTVSSSYPFGRYMEDNAYLGDLTNSATGSNYVHGVDFDLNEYNGRFCVTPEFPGGTYAYFVSISSSSSNAVPTFPLQHRPRLLRQSHRRHRHHPDGNRDHQLSSAAPTPPSEISPRRP